jgi:hypothetical protein
MHAHDREHDRELDQRDSRSSRRARGRTRAHDCRWPWDLLGFFIDDRGGHLDCIAVTAGT